MGLNPEPNVEAAVRVRGLRHAYGEREVLRGVELELGAGETAVVVGPNGSGKTTLLRILATLLRPGGGEIEVLGCSIPSESWKLRGRIGYLGHEPLLYRDLSGRENLRFHARLHGLNGEEAEERVEEVLDAVAMSGRADDRIDDLSAGMRQRLAICRCALHRPDILLLDEPDSNLDAESRRLAAALIGPPGSRGDAAGSTGTGAGFSVTRVLVTHDPDRHTAEADQVLTLGHG